ncbi:hypothetical protein OIO90_002477 [Microbotryomycetes sp. JL221]|nr:hypothetical protein OIO90_002477 [Microbotryomycetes sp. JL221]
MSETHIDKKSRRRSSNSISTRPDMASQFQAPHNRLLQLSTRDPAALVLSVGHALATRSSSLSPVGSTPSQSIHRMPSLTRRLSLRTSIGPPPPLTVEAGNGNSPPPAPNAWCGGSTSTLDFALRAGDKSLERQERARLNRIGLGQPEDDSKSCASSDHSGDVALDQMKHASKLPPSSSRRVLSVGSFPTKESSDVSSWTLTEEDLQSRPPSRGRSRAIRDNVRYISKGLKALSASGRTVSAFGHRSHAWPGSSPLKPSRGSKMSDRPRAPNVTQTASSESRGCQDRATQDNLNPDRTLVKRLSSATFDPLQSPPTLTSPRAPPSTRQTLSGGGKRHSLDGPIVMRGFDAPRHQQTKQDDNALSATRHQLGVSETFLAHDSTRIARGRAASFAAHQRGRTTATSGSRSPPTSQIERNVSRDLVKLYSRRKMSSPERRAIEARLAGKTSYRD